jgi:hypothetical protein
MSLSEEEPDVPNSEDKVFDPASEGADPEELLVCTVVCANEALASRLAVRAVRDQIELRIVVMSF